MPVGERRDVRAFSVREVAFGGLGQGHAPGKSGADRGSLPYREPFLLLYDDRGLGFDSKNPLQIFDEVYNTILDRRVHPKEGSYTNYLFEKGIDKILKKVGEEATEIVIAAKNPNPEEVKYEICDFLYHAMVLMVERGVTWEDITKELADR